MNGFEEVPALGADEKFAYAFKRSAVERADISHFLQFFDIGRIRKADRLHNLYGSVVFSIDGFDADRRPLHEISEVRTFIRELVKSWPYFFYADALENGFLNTIIFCLLDELIMIDRENSSQFGIQFSPNDANRAAEPLFKGLQSIAGMDRHLNQPLFDSRIEAIQTHLRSGTKKQ
jgi:hypothetical protein